MEAISIYLTAKKKKAAVIRYFRNLFNIFDKRRNKKYMKPSFTQYEDLLDTLKEPKNCVVTLSQSVRRPKTVRKRRRIEIRQFTRKDMTIMMMTIMMILMLTIRMMSSMRRCRLAYAKAFDKQSTSYTEVITPVGKLDLFEKEIRTFQNLYWQQTTFI